ncbi:MAG: hypothetical protein R3A80_08560 [Bdellovibrionota bacterium]
MKKIFLLTVLISSSLLFANPPERPAAGGQPQGGQQSGDLVIGGEGIWPRANHISQVEDLKAVDLEQVDQFNFELAGQTSVNLSAKKRDNSVKVSFVTRNEAANANSEIAYFNLARILGVDKLFRAAVPYTLGRNASRTFAALIERGSFRGMRAKNATEIAERLQSNSLKGCLKEKKRGQAVVVNEISSDNAPKLRYQLISDLQANNPQPSDNNKTSMRGITKNERGSQVGIDVWAPRATIARQYSILMTLDAVFGQWDRYSGSNIGFRLKKDTQNNEVEVYSTDNGGADFWGTKWTLRQASWFSRYDKQVILDLQKIYSFLSGQARSLRSERLQKTWTDPEEFVVDLGLYYEASPASYVKNLTKNLGAFLAVVERNVSSAGEARAFFQ